LKFSLYKNIHLHPLYCSPTIFINTHFIAHLGNKWEKSIINKGVKKGKKIMQHIQKVERSRRRKKITYSQE